MNRKGYVVVGILAAFIAGYINLVPARSVSSSNSFYRVVEKRRLAVAMFYRSDKKSKKENRAQYDRITSAKSAFKIMNDVRQYKKADVQFIRVNVAESKLSELPSDFGITVGQEPVYLLFNNGKLIKNSSGAIARAQGFLKVEQLRSFIDGAMGDAIEDYLDDKAEKRARERAERRVYYSMGGGYPWYGYYPYYGGYGGYGGYGYGGRVGFGVSFGF